MISGFSKQKKKCTHTVNLFLVAETIPDAGSLCLPAPKAIHKFFAVQRILKCKTHECGASLTNKKKLFLSIKQFICKTSVITKAP